MKELTSFDQWKDKVKGQETFLLYAYSPGCSVCLSDFPRVEKLVEMCPIDSYKVNIGQIPQMAGQLSLFSAPCVLVFYKGKEWHRQARIIDFRELEKRIAPLLGQI